MVHDPNPKEPDVNLEQRFAHAAENAFLKFAARWVMVALIPIGGAVVGVGTWAINRMIHTLDVQTDALADIKLRVGGMETNYQNLSLHFIDVNNIVNSRFEAVRGRLDKQENDIDDLKKRVYPWTNGPPPVVK